MAGTGFPRTGDGPAPSGADWIALSDCESPVAGPATLARGLFVLEFRLPLGEPTVLASIEEPERGQALSIFYHPDTGPSVLIRSGGRARRHRIETAPAPDLAGVARLSLWLDAGFGAGTGVWRLGYQVIDRSALHLARGDRPLPFDTALIRRLADRMGGGFRHPSVLWFGLSSGQNLPQAAPWIGPMTPIETDCGPVPAGELRPGMRIRTLDQGFLPLRALNRMELPAAGSFAPVVLRQPFFAAQRDLLVSADQLLLISGPSVEYLTGEEEVLVPASALADGRVAERDNRRAVTRSVALDLGQPALVEADGCCLLSATPGGTAKLPRRTLANWEMTPLLALLGRASLRRAA